MGNLHIAPLQTEEISDFLTYLNDHLSDNGAIGAPLFQPLGRRESTVPASMKESFVSGLACPLDQLGWRRVWVATAGGGAIAGHIDLRSHREKHTLHRALLGMGVDRNHRRMGVGGILMGTALQWAQREAGLEFIDLQVLAQNHAAIRLYEKSGFTRVGEMVDMFRIDGNSYNYTHMCKKLFA